MFWFYVYSFVMAPFIFFTTFIVLGLPITLLFRGFAAPVNAVLSLAYTAYWAVTPNPWPHSMILSLFR